MIHKSLTEYVVSELMHFIREIEQELEIAFSPVEGALTENSAHMYHRKYTYQLVRTLQRYHLNLN